MMVLLALAAATLVSEDLTALAAGALIANGTIAPLAGVTACAAGIFLGDLALFAAGRVAGGRVLAWERVARALPLAQLERLRRGYGRHLGLVILGSRVVPGTRLPLYLAAGAIGCSVPAFAGWSALAVSLWTPALVLAAVHAPGVPFGDRGGTRLAIGALVLVFLRGAIRWGLAARRRERMIAAVSRVWRWEFWPMWLFYAPVGCWIALLAIRFRGLGAISAANPGVPDGGIVGESKFEIFSRLPAEWTIAAATIPRGTLDARVWRLTAAMTSHGWTFPIVLKPDVGQRGTGVKLIHSLTEARLYLEREASAVIAQPYHSGPFEAGIFYYRWPGQPQGRILSVTDKHFPAVVGDGVSTLEELIWRHPRLRMQAATFLSRHAHAKNRIPAASERVPLAMAGNHCQGTLFRDGRHLITPALEERVDTIARSYPGFFIGRFDVRYADVERFKSGDDLAIVELNGATAESTNIYDPAGSLLGAYRQLFRQWWLVFAIGAANRANGASSTSARRLVALVRAHLTARSAFDTSD
jgi:membrane protein DedA with SNARE-associated domain